MSENSNHIDLKDLKQQIESLAMIMKGDTVGNIKPKMGGRAPPKETRKCIVILLRKPLQDPPEDPRSQEMLQKDRLNLDKNL